MVLVPQQIFHGSFQPSGTVQYTTVRYAIMSVSIVRSCEWYQNSEPYRTTFLVPFCWGTEHSKGYQKGGAKGLTRIVTFAWYKRIKLLLHSFRSAVHECWAYLHQSAQPQKNITVYFIILYFHTDNSRFSICVIFCSCGLEKRHCPKTLVIFKILLLCYCHEM